MAQYAEVGGLLEKPEVSRWQLRSVRALGVALASCALVLLGFAAGQGAGLPHSQYDGLMQRDEVHDRQNEAVSTELQQYLKDALTKCDVGTQGDSVACKHNATAQWVKFVNLEVLKVKDPDQKRVREACVAIGRLFPDDERRVFFGPGHHGLYDVCGNDNTLYPRFPRAKAEQSKFLHMFGGDNFKDVHETLPLDASWDSISAKIESLEMEGSAVYCLSGDWVEMDEDSFRSMLDYQCEPILLVDYTTPEDDVLDDLREKVYNS